MTLSSKGPGDDDRTANLENEENAEDSIRNELDRKNLKPENRQKLEQSLEQVQEREDELAVEETEDGIRRALARTDLSSEDRAQFEQALQRLQQQPKS